MALLGHSHGRQKLLARILPRDFRRMGLMARATQGSHTGYVPCGATCVMAIVRSRRFHRPRLARSTPLSHGPGRKPATCLHRRCQKAVTVAFCLSRISTITSMGLICMSCLGGMGPSDKSVSAHRSRRVALRSSCTRRPMMRKMRLRV